MVIFFSCNSQLRKAQHGSPFKILSIICLNLFTIENEDKLLWNPYLLSEEASEEYLAKSQENIQGGNGVSSLPFGSHIRDDEQVRVCISISI